jgi:hypothetical protein
VTIGGRDDGGHSVEIARMRELPGNAKEIREIEMSQPQDIDPATAAI